MRKKESILIASSIEHPSVTESLEQLKTAFGFEVTYLPVDGHGFVSLEDLKQALRKDTILVSIMHVNNETGVIQPLEEIGKIVKENTRAYFHVDHVQGTQQGSAWTSPGQPLTFVQSSGHKFHGLKGTGALILENERISLFSFDFAEENSRTTGVLETENTAGAVTLAKAINFFKTQRL